MKHGFLAMLFFITACQRPVLNEAELFDGAIIVQLEGHRLMQLAESCFEMSPELPNSKIEKVSYLRFEPQELKLALDSIHTTDFANMLHRVYGLTLKRNMGAFGGLMKSYLEYFDKFQIVSLESVARGGKTWQSLLKKHNEENHYWQSFYTTHKKKLVFITFFYALGAEESTIPTTELTKYLDVVRFERENSNAE